MKSLKSLIFVLTTLPIVASAGESLMYKHYLKLAEKYKIEVTEPYDKQNLDDAESRLKTKYQTKDQIKEQMKLELFRWIRAEKINGGTNLDTDYNDFGQAEQPPQATVPASVPLQSEAQDLKLATSKTLIPKKTPTIVKQEPSEFSKLLRKLNANGDNLLGIIITEKALLEHNEERCKDNSKDEILRKRLKVHAIKSISHENKGKMLWPEKTDIDGRRELNQFANKLFRSVCGRAPYKTKQVVKKPVETVKLVVQSEPTPTIPVEKTKVESLPPEEVKNDTCNIDEAAKFFESPQFFEDGVRSIDKVKSALAILYREAIGRRPKNDNPEINLRLYIFYYLVHNQSMPSMRDPYKDPSLGNLAKCAIEQAEEEEKNKRELRTQEAVKQYQYFLSK